MSRALALQGVLRTCARAQVSLSRRPPGSGPKVRDVSVITLTAGSSSSKTKVPKRCNDAPKGLHGGAVKRAADLPPRIFCRAEWPKARKLWPPVAADRTVGLEILRSTEVSVSADLFPFRSRLLVPLQSLLTL